jgi:sugar diacid utilization regulator
VFAFAAADPADQDTAVPDGIIDVIAAVLSAHGISAFTGAASRDVVAIFPWELGTDELTHVARDMSAEVARQANQARIIIGVGDLAAGAGALREPLVRAREVCQVLRVTEGKDTATFADIATFRMLFGLLDDQVRRRFAQQVLGVIREHDLKANTELEQTLRVFLANDGRWAVTAAELHLHVNTLRNRIARITELTGRDVNRLESKIDLFLALYLVPDE